GIHGLWVVNVLDPSSQPLLLVTDAQLGNDGDVQGNVAWASNGQVVFRANHEMGGVWAMYRAAADGSSVEVIEGASLTNVSGAATIGSFGVSADGNSLAFSANSPVERCLR
ncbi:MAG: hypothetical protein CSA75_03850, partial [Sorangium cellulosum]